MKLSWDLRCATALWTEGLCSLLGLVADCCQVAEGVEAACGVHVTLTEDTFIRQMNREYRQVDRATDVLSFPAVDYPQGKTARQCPRLLRREWDPEEHACLLGDIVISVEHAQAQAAEYGHSLRRELAYLLAHGLFHLFGYDHMNAGEQKEMRQMEEKALQMVGVSRDGAASSITDEELLSLARQAMQRSYSPYSRYKVGAALLCADGRVFTGTNVENASYGLSNCGERTAVFKAISEGARDFTTIAIAAEDSAPYPCGACRQVLNEFAPDIRVLVTWGNGQVEESSLPQLLPRGFGPKDLP